MPESPPNMSSLLDDPSASEIGGKGTAQSTEPAWSLGSSRVKLIAAVVMLVLAAGVLGWQLMSGERSVASETSERVVIDSETGEVIKRFDIPKTPAPWTNPRSGKATLFAAEACFWTKDGKAKTEPTYVLLNQYTGKPGPTICPDCGRRVTWLNALPPGKLMDEAYEREKSGK